MVIDCVAGLYFKEEDDTLSVHPRFWPPWRQGPYQ